MAMLNAPSAVTRRSVVLRTLPAGAVGLLGMACTAGGPPPQKPTELSGTFDLFIQNFAPFMTMHERMIESFKAIAPNARITSSASASGTNTLLEKARATAAAGAGPDGLQTYTDYWRGVDAATIFLPLTPLLMSRKDAEAISAPHLLDSMWSKKREVYIIPQAVGVNGAGLQYNVGYLNAAGIDPKRLTTLDAILEAGAKLVQRDGTDVTRGGLRPGEATSCVYNWILDQGGKFYDDKTNKWTWQTVEAERAFQWLLDLYDRHRLTWRMAPSGVTNPVGQGRLAMDIVGPWSISGLWATFPDVKVLDQPLPAFVAGKQPNYWLAGITGMTLSNAVKPDSAAAKIGAAYYKHLYSTENRLKVEANEYSGLILNNAVYTDPKFKDTKFAAVRTDFTEKVLKRTVITNPAASPGVAPQWTKILNSELSIKAALAELQQIHQTAEEEALRSRQ